MGKATIKNKFTGFCREVKNTLSHYPTRFRLLNAVSYLVCIQVIGLLVLTLFRLGLYISCHDFLDPKSHGQFWLQFQGFLNGLWYDNVVACAILVVPLTIIVICCTAGVGNRRMLVYASRWMQVLYGLAFVASAADIPYFKYFNTHLNSTIWNWAEYGGETFGMILGEPSYYPPMIAFFVIIIGFVWITNRIRRYFVAESYALPSFCQRVTTFILGAVCIGLAIFGVRGRDGREPINAAAAYYCDDLFLDKLGLNPTYFLIRTSLDDMKKKTLDLMPTDEAYANVQELLGREGNEWSPVYYDYKPAADSLNFNGYNVVFVLMESMSDKLTHIGLTPFIDSLETKTIYFDNCWSAGTHTSIGMYSTLYSWPGILKNNMLKDSNTPIYSGLPTVLQDNGYQTMFFMTHDQQYDNMSAFFYTNGYKELYSREDYPKSEVANCWGVRDHFLFNYALNVLDEKAKNPNPFFATILSISNHPPYSVPDDFKGKTKDDETRIVEYADWSLEQFFNEAEKRSWYDHTIFIIQADHGKIFGQLENVDPPQCFNHIPLMFLLPGVEPQVRHQLMTQMDVQPTILGLLDIEAPQNNFGMDALQHEREYAYYCSDDAICCRDSNSLFTYQPGTGLEMLYRDNKIVKESDEHFDQMRTYVFSMIQTAQQLVKEKKTTATPNKQRKN